MLTYEDFPLFYNNPMIQKIAKNPRWTVSGQIGESNKAPLDITEWINDPTHIWGVSYNRGHHPLVDLSTLCQVMPGATNNAYALDASLDKIVILDIEPSCPEDIKNELMKLPYLYAETSMSGKGIHMIFELPLDLFNKYPNAQTKQALRADSGYYEILLQHFVTFTRNAIPPANMSLNPDGFRILFEEMCKTQKATIKTSVDAESLKEQHNDIPDYDTITKHLARQNYYKTEQDFLKQGTTEPDLSKYEYNYCLFLLNKLNAILDVSFIKGNGHQYTDDEKAWFIYVVVQEKLEERPKHNEYRCGLPWLLWIAATVIAKDNKNNSKTIESK